MKKNTVFKSLMLVCFGLSFLSIHVQAQYPMEIIDVSRATRDVLYGERFKDILGSPFTTENWIIGELIDNKGTAYSNVMYKYDAYNDEIVLKTQDEQVFVLGKTQVADFKYTNNGKQFHYTKVRISEVEAIRYMRIIHSGKIKMYEKTSKEIQKEQSTYNGYGGGYSPQDEFAEKITYYLKKDDESILKIDLKTKNILKALDDKEDEIKEFVKKNKINVKEEKDLVNLLTFYDSLF